MLTEEPSTVVQGNTWQWSRDFPDYPAGGSYTLAYYFKSPDSAFSISGVEITANGSAFVATKAATDTASIRPGSYFWQAYATSGAARYLAGEGWMSVTPDLATAGGYDARAHAQKVLDAVEATLEGRASLDQLAISIGGRSLSRTPIGDLLALRDHYRREVQALKSAAALENELGNRRRLFVRFGRA